MKKYLLTLLTLIIVNVLPVKSQNYALTFDGVNDHVTLPASLWANNFSNGTAITVEFWFKGNRLTSAYRVQTGDYFVAGWENGQTNQHIISSDGATSGVSSGTFATINNGQWHHLAMTWTKNGLFTSYLDGTQVAQRAAANSNLPSMNGINYLAAYNGTSEYLQGVLDEVRIWNYSRSAQQIADNKNYELTGSESGLVAYYKMSNGSGTSLSDNTSSSNYSGTLVNGVTWTEGAPVTPAVINGNYALTFNGTTGYVSLPSALWHSNFSAQTAISVEFWFKGSAINSVYRVQPGAEYFVAGYSNGTHIISSDGLTNGISQGDMSTIQNGSWHHLAMTWQKNGLFTSYLDGTQVAQRVAANSNLPSMDVTNYLGSWGGVWEFMTGTLDEVRIWNDVRTAQEIAGYKDLELTGTEAGLVAYYKMSNGSGNTLTDNRSNTYPGNLNGGISWTSGHPYQASITATGTLSSFTSCYGTVSGEQSFTASGTGLTADIIVTAPTGFELSTSAGGSFSTTLTLNETAGIVNSTTVYVRLTSSATGSPSGNITLTSTGATTQNVAASGTVNTLPVVNAGSDQSVSTSTVTLDGSISGSASTGTWSGGLGTYNPDNTSLSAVYTPTSTERLNGLVTLTLTSADPSGPCGSASDQVTLTFEPASKISISDGYWETDALWSPSGTPTLIDNVTVNHSVAVHSSAASSPAICNTLSVNSGKLLTVETGNALTLLGNLSNPEGATLTVASGGSLITNGSISNSGTINISRDISESAWHLVSIPVTSASANTFLGDYLQSWNESTGVWTDIVEPGTELTAGQGYGLYGTPGKAPSANNYTYTVTGTPNTGNVQREISFTLVNGKDFDGANLLGNPYPSAIDWEQVSGYGSVYYWNGSAYVSYPQIGGFGPGSRYIPPMQGFFILVPDNDPNTFTFTNAMRTHAGATIYYKSSNSLSDGLMLSASNGQYVDKLLIRQNETATASFDFERDAWKLPSNTPGLSQLWSICADGNLSIDVRPATDVIQLGFANDQEGIYSIALDEMAGIGNAILEDTRENTFTDLSKGAYSFNWQPTDNELRFRLHLGALAVGKKETNATRIYSYQNIVYVELKNHQQGDIFIYNMAGQLITSRKAANGLLPFTLSTQGVYIVKVVSDTQTTTAKILIQ